MNCRVVPSRLAHCCLLVPGYACQRPTSSSSYDSHDYSDPDDTLSAGYDFMNEVSHPISNLSLSRLQSPHAEILIIIIVIVIKLCCSSHRGCHTIPHMYTWKAAPAPLDIPSLIRYNDISDFSCFMEYLIKVVTLINLLIIVILPESEETME